MTRPLGFHRSDLHWAPLGPAQLSSVIHVSFGIDSREKKVDCLGSDYHAYLLNEQAEVGLRLRIVNFQAHPGSSLVRPGARSPAGSLPRAHSSRLADPCRTRPMTLSQFARFPIYPIACVFHDFEAHQLQKPPSRSSNMQTLLTAVQ